MDSELNKLFNENCVEECKAVPYDFCEGVWLPLDYLDIKEAIRNFKVRDDDIFICGFQKTGTTWTREMVWCVANDLDFQGAKEKLYLRFHHLEAVHAFRARCVMERKNLTLPGLTIPEIEQLPSPRFLLSHLPYHLLPKDLIEGKTNAKIVYVSRDPKDTCISSYHYFQHAEGYCGSFEDFCKLFMAGRVVMGPFWNHVMGFWNHKESKNLLLLKYEDMKKDLPSAIRKTASFLGKSLNDDQIRLLEDHLSFKNMQSNPAVNLEEEFQIFKELKLWNGFEVKEKFIRKGELDQWKKDMSQNLIQQFNNWTESELGKLSKLKPEVS